MFPIKANYMMMMDNLMDLSHLGYVHAKTIGGNPVRSFNDLAPHLNDLDNALIMLETVLPPAEDPGEA